MVTKDQLVNLYKNLVPFYMFTSSEELNQQMKYEVKRFSGLRFVANEQSPSGHSAIGRVFDGRAFLNLTDTDLIFSIEAYFSLRRYSLQQFISFILSHFDIEGFLDSKLSLDELNQKLKSIEQEIIQLGGASFISTIHHIVGYAPETIIGEPERFIMKRSDEKIKPFVVSPADMQTKPTPLITDEKIREVFKAFKPRNDAWRGWMLWCAETDLPLISHNKIALDGDISVEQLLLLGHWLENKLRTRTFPIMNDDAVKHIPWRFLDEAMAELNHGESLDYLAAQGGLGIVEAYANIKKITISELMDNDVHSYKQKAKDFLMCSILRGHTNDDQG